MNLTWVCKHFNDLTPHELYAIIRLRNAVFVVEQNCVFQDADDKDQNCHHLMGWNGNLLAAYTRLVPPGIAYEQMSIGRVITDPSVRRFGAGKALMTESIEQCNKYFGKGEIQIGAQLYLKKFYESFGFHQVGEIYDEDGIDHIHMIRS
jgi:ElaA protein